MTRILWILLRFSLSAWVGAAALFVVTGVLEVTSTLFEPQTKNLLATIRFPAYYVFGFTLVGASVLTSGSLLAMKHAEARRAGLRAVFVLCTVGILFMAADYVWVYTPLHNMMLEPEARMNPDFWSYHKWSKYVNAFSISLCLIAAVIAADEPSASGKDKD